MPESENVVAASVPNKPKTYKLSKEKIKARTEKLKARCDADPVLHEHVKEMSRLCMKKNYDSEANKVRCETVGYLTATVARYQAKLDKAWELARSKPVPVIVDDDDVVLPLPPPKRGRPWPEKVFVDPLSTLTGAKTFAAAAASRAAVAATTAARTAEAAALAMVASNEATAAAVAAAAVVAAFPPIEAKPKRTRSIKAPAPLPQTGEALTPEISE